jgi:KaiC/GvpD/RAD55 family RecA-like ATPase
LISGTAGSGKTVFAVQFLAEGVIKTDEAGVFVTFEESPVDICQNDEELKLNNNGGAVTVIKSANEE